MSFLISSVELKNNIGVHEDAISVRKSYPNSSIQKGELMLRFLKNLTVKMIHEWLGFSLSDFYNLLL
ncbi:MAG: hypothetical protein H7A24_17445 [Leptospiraceae bacterium]|nr:hypothetical protein [Leptospiraceae bacterium]MCP5513678.1 hypothetical protein [Leptospiraceae bacterium]